MTLENFVVSESKNNFNMLGVHPACVFTMSVIL
jgi:hypothetical protein